MDKRREIKESPFYQRSDEQIAYTITVPTSWGTSSFSSLSTTLYEDPDGDNTDVSATKVTGSTTASGQVITTGLVKSLTAGKKYRVEVKWTTSESNVVECYGIIYCNR